MNNENDKQKDIRLSQLLSTTDGNTTGPDEEFLDKLQEQSTAEFLASSANETKNSQTETILPIWRIIMKSNITKFAAAVVIIGLVLFGVTLLETTTTPAYAVEQTIEAMRNITSVHCFINTFTGDKIELWVEVNPETGANEKIYSESSQEIRVTTPNESYVYEKNTNIFKHIKGSLDRMDIRLGRFIEDMVAIAKAMKADIKKTEEINSNKKVILLVLETDQFILESRVDSETILPISMTMKPKGQLQPGQLGQSIEDFSFNEPLPEGIFDFEIPEGAQVVEQ